MAFSLRIMAWNIATGNADGRLPYHGALPRISEQIRAISPDIVLLNEVHNRTGPGGDGVNQVREIARLTNLPNYHWGNTVKTGLTGHKAVAVLSRYPVQAPRVHPVMRGSQRTTYAMLEATVMVENVGHQVFSLRFDAHNTSDNVAGHQQAVDLVRKMNPRVPVIFGGDFNADQHTEHMKNFVAHSTLTDAFTQRPDPDLCTRYGPRIDFLFYRGPYTVSRMEQRCPWGAENEASDHPWVFAELTGQLPVEEPHLLRDGGLFYTNDTADRIAVTVEPNAVAADTVEFVLRALHNVTWRKEVVIREGPTVGRGAWTIFTRDNRREDRNGLYASQLSGGSLTFRKAKMFGAMSDVGVIHDLSAARPGSRITCTWERD